MPTHKAQPPQRQTPPGTESAMEPRPETIPRHPGSGRLEGKIALITGGDSGIGRAVALAFANEGADVAIVYKSGSEDGDARETQKLVEGYGRKCITLVGDVSDPEFCRQAVDRTLSSLGALNILVNNAAEQHPQEEFKDITPEQMEETFETNVFGYFYMARVALLHLKSGDSIINTSSVTAYKGNANLIDYAATKGAIISFTRSLALNLAQKDIRVNAVAPGPIWTPLIPSTFPSEKVEKFGTDRPLGRAGQPNEVAPSYVFLASDDASYMTGQVLHPNGGDVVNG